MKENIGEFIREQRDRHKISQNKLSELLFVDRTLISKWENGKARPVIEEVIKMAEIFNISVEEFLAAEEYTENNKETIKDNLNDFLIKQSSKVKKLSSSLKHLAIVFILILCIFFGYYFYQTYNKTKVYRVYGSTTSHEFYNGVLLITRNKSYFRVGSLDNNVDRIVLSYKDNNDEVVLYEGDLDKMIIGYTGYDASLNIYNFDKVKDNINLTIFDSNGNSEVMHLSFDPDFKNDDILFDDNNEFLKNKDGQDINNSIPNYIKNNSKCDELNCIMQEDDMEVIYDIISKSIYITKKNETISYDSLSDCFVYNDNKNSLSFNVISEQFNYQTFSENEAKNIYQKYKSIIDKYLN